MNGFTNTDLLIVKYMLWNRYRISDFSSPDMKSTYQGLRCFTESLSCILAPLWGANMLHKRYWIFFPIITFFALSISMVYFSWSRLDATKFKNSKCFLNDICLNFVQMRDWMWSPTSFRNCRKICWWDLYLNKNKLTFNRGKSSKSSKLSWVEVNIIGNRRIFEEIGVEGRKSWQTWIEYRMIRYFIELILQSTRWRRSGWCRTSRWRTRRCDLKMLVLNHWNAISFGKFNWRNFGFSCTKLCLDLSFLTLDRQNILHYR